jgi:transcriptional regulator with XRE-family HTH domain
MGHNLISGFDNMKTHEKLRALRTAKGFSQQYVAHKLNLDPANYGRLERGEAKLTVERLEQVLVILGVKLQDFFVADNTEFNKLESNCQQSNTLLEHLLKEVTVIKELLINSQKT